MADNYLENKMESYRSRESDKESRRKKDLAKKMKAYEEKLLARRNKEFGK
ncbi:MAG: hypothetical protein MJY56_08115 [Bacteroidales bacterium]|nr:hypothetical protein [Bacteroidales bacterium]